MARKPISARTRYLILERDGFTCQCCGAKAPNCTLHVDHIAPVAKGGSDHETNLRAICVTCNIGKSDIEPNTPPLPTAAVVPFPKQPIRISDKEVTVRGEALTEPLLWIGEQWAVTPYGIECRDGNYAIEKERLWECEGSGWSWKDQIRTKDWANSADFSQAFNWAERYFEHLKPKRRTRRS